MKKPFLALWIFYILGIFLDYKYDIPLGWYKGLMCASGILFLVSRFVLNKKTYLFLLLSSLSLGGLFFNLDYNRYTDIELSADSDNEIKVRVLKEKTIEEEYGRYIAEDEYGERILLTVYADIDLRTGDIAKVSGEIKGLKDNTNPGLFSSKDYYRSQYIYRNIVADKVSVEIVERNNLSLLESYSQNFKGLVENTVNQSLNSQDRDIIKSMILGDSSYIEQKRLQRFRDLGLGHMMAVSGLHIGIIFGAMLFVLRDIAGFHKRIAEITGLAFIWIYILLIGSPTSSIRAGTMISLLVISKLIHRRYDSINIIATIGLGMLLFKPLWALSLGYQLSFAGVVSLTLVKSGKWKSLFSIFLGLLPLNMYYFNVIPFVSILSNIALVPILSFSLIASFPMVLISMLSLRLSKMLGMAIDYMLYINDLLMSMLDSYYRKITVGSPSLVEMLFWYILIFIVLKTIDITLFKRDILKSFISYSIIVALFTAINPYGDNVIEIDFLDVGQGDCTVIRTAEKSYMVDSGGSVFSDYDVGEHTVYPYLVKQGVTRLDGFIVSHFDADHMKGFLYLMDKIEIGEIIIGYKSPENGLYRELILLAEDNDIPIRLIESPSSLALDVDNRMIFIPPDSVGDENNSSLILLLESFNKKLLFSGDIEDEREKELVRANLISDIDILKVPHHGSKTSSTQEFLEATSPEVGVIQVGNNNFGHPSTEVLDRYRDIGAEIYRNDLSGMIKLKVDKNGYTIDEFSSPKTALGEELWNYRWAIVVSAAQLYIWIVLTRGYSAESYSAEMIGRKNVEL